MVLMIMVLEGHSDVFSALMVLEKIDYRCDIPVFCVKPVPACETTF